MKKKIQTLIGRYNIVNWHRKRALLNVIWGALNICMVVGITTQLIHTRWEILWLVFTVIYASIFWILSSIIFDQLIGDEIDGIS